jgi:hypothetical protein
MLSRPWWPLIINGLSSLIKNIMLSRPNRLTINGLANQHSGNINNAHRPARVSKTMPKSPLVNKFFYKFFLKIPLAFQQYWLYLTINNKQIYGQQPKNIIGHRFHRAPYTNLHHFETDGYWYGSRLVLGMGSFTTVDQLDGSHSGYLCRLCLLFSL